MRLDKLLDGLDYEIIKGDDKTWIDGVTHNAGEVDDKSCYIVLHTDDTGIQRARDAVRNRATAIITDKYIRVDGGDVTVAVVKNIRKAYAVIAANYYNKEFARLKLVGVIGTNGKTTTAYLIWTLLNRIGVKAGFIGTGQYMIGEVRYENGSTTPDPMQLHAILANMAESGVKVVVMEVSAHAIYLDKIYGLSYEIGIFTNLSQDHLDYFDTLEKISEVKQSFFLNKYCRIAIVNGDDDTGRKLKEKIVLPNFTYGIDGEYDICADSIKCCDKGAHYIMRLGKREWSVDTCFFGKYNIYNCLAAIITVKLLGGSMERILDELALVTPPSGRANIIEYCGVRYIVDYAHTPEGLKNVLKEAKNIALDGRVICVFGAGGERDRAKRPLMGAAADSIADIIILTEDNPRGENVKDINNDILQGVMDKDKVLCYEDRYNAIAKAVNMSKRGDVIVIAGKGAEEYIEKNGRKYSYSDKDAIEEILKIKWI